MLQEPKLKGNRKPCSIKNMFFCKSTGPGSGQGDPSPRDSSFNIDELKYSRNCCQKSRTCAISNLVEVNRCCWSRGLINTEDYKSNMPSLQYFNFGRENNSQYGSSKKTWHKATTKTCNELNSAVQTAKIVVFKRVWFAFVLQQQAIASLFYSV